MSAKRRAHPSLMNGIEDGTPCDPMTPSELAPAPSSEILKRSAVCPECNTRVRITVPAGGDGSVDVFVRHRDRQGRRCPGSRRIVSPNDQAHPTAAEK